MCTVLNYQEKTEPQAQEEHENFTLRDLTWAWTQNLPTVKWLCRLLCTAASISKTSFLNVLKKEPRIPGKFTCWFYGWRTRRSVPWMAEKKMSDQNRLNWFNCDDRGTFDWSKCTRNERSLSPVRRCNWSRQQCVIQLILGTIEIQKYIKFMVTVALIYIYINERFLRRGCPGDGCSFKVIPGDNITR